MMTKIAGRIRKVLEGIDIGSSGDDEQLVLSGQSELLVANGASARGEVVRAGRAFWTGTTTAVAAVVAIPSTGVNVALYNNDVDSGRSLVIDWVAAQNVVSTAVVAQAQMLMNIGQVREAIPADAALTIKKRNGLGSGTNDTKVRTIVGGTALPAATGIAANWVPVGAASQKPSAVATPGYGMYQQIDGDIIVPPGRYFALNVIANVVGETFVAFVGWHERQLALG
jgi:hypothetical protein